MHMPAGANCHETVKVAKAAKGAVDGELVAGLHPREHQLHHSHLQEGAEVSDL